MSSLGRIWTGLILVLLGCAWISTAEASKPPAVHSTPSARTLVILDTVAGKRDPLQHLLSAARWAPSSKARVRIYLELAMKLDQAGRHREALRASEAAALEGSWSAAERVLKAGLAGRYRVTSAATLVDKSVLPAAEAGGVNATLMMARLVANGRISGKVYNSSTYWYGRAADLGSRAALRVLAQGAEAKGNVASASKYYARIDGKSLSRLARALKQAQAFYLGNAKVKRDRSIGLAWLQFASDLNKVEAGKVAAKLFRKAPGTKSANTLLAIATKGGINPQSSGSLAAQLAAAATEAERKRLIAAVKKSADKGDAGAAFLYWQTQVQLGEADGARSYLEAATRKGNAPAIASSGDLLAQLPLGDPVVGELLAPLQSVADAGNIAALTVLGNIYATGGPVAPDAVLSWDFYRRAADLGDVDSALRVGIYYSTRTDDPVALSLARRYLELASGKGSASAKVYLAELPPA